MTRGGPEEAWRWRHDFTWEDQQWVWRWKRGIFLDISLAWKAGRLCSPFSRGCTKPLKGRERGRRIALC